MTQGVANALAQAVGAGVGLWLAFVIFSWFAKRSTRKAEVVAAVERAERWIEANPALRSTPSLNYTQVYRTFPSED